MRKFIIAFVFGACLLPDAALTLGLGEIEVNSALNQKLDAEIALLSATPEDAEQLIVKLAPAAEFSRAGIDRPFLLNSLRFSTLEKNGELFIKVTTAKPVREPYLNFLLEIDWPKGHLLREYTILLDPPVYMGAEDTTASVRPAAMQPSSRPAARADEPSQGGYRPAAAPAPAASPPAAPAQLAPRPAAAASSAPMNLPAPAGSRRVQAGDTAWSLAKAMRPDASISTEQMLIAMLRSNPEVFINNNVNGLKRGYILRAPDYDDIAAIDRDQAAALVREQNALWREYQQALAGGTPASALEAGNAAVTEPAAVPAGSEARLNIVSAGSGEGAGGSKDPTQMSLAELRRELALASEQLETERVEKEALNARVQALQAEVEKMKALLTIEDQAMAEMQAAAESGAAPAEAPTATEASQPEVADATPEAEPVTDSVAETDRGEAGGEPEQAAPLAEDESPVFVDEQPGETAMEAESPAEQAPLAGDDIMDTMPSDFVTPQKPDPLAQLLANPLLLGGIGGGVLIIILLIVFLIKRRKAAAEEATPAVAPLPVEDELEKVADMVEDEAVSDVVSDETVEASMAEAEAEAEADDFDTESTMILSTEDTVVTQADELADEAEEERDDVIAEADVYLAYGIYQQAEELLQNAISEHPDRDAYRVKLAETHYASKNADAFVDVARELKEKSGTDSKGWAKVVAMGKDLCPDNDLFTASDMVDGVDLGELAPKVPEMDFDLEGEAGGEAEEAPDLDFSLDDAPLDLPDAGAEDTAILEADEAAGADSAEEELEFDLSEAEAVPADLDNKEEDEFSLDIDAAELDLDVKDEAASGAEDEIDFTAEFADSGEDGKDDTGADAGEDELEVDISAELDETIITEAVDTGEELDMALDSTEAAPAADDDLDLELGLETAESESETEAPTETEDEALELDEGVLGDLDDVDEVATKLDLARAYLDMGDSEGTRSILDEVMAEGNDEQKKEAQELLDQLG